MAETAGLVIGAVGLTALFDSCMNAFQYVESARHFGTDYQQTAFRLSLLQLRLSRWAKPISFIDEELTDVTQIPTGVGAASIAGPRIQVATDEEIVQVKYLLGKIYAGFQDAERASEAYKMKSPLSEETDTAAKSRSATIAMLTDRVRQVSLHRQKHTSIMQKTKWALQDARKFNHLVINLAESITDLEKLFPVLRPNQELLVVSDVKDLIQPSEIEEPADGELSVKEVIEEATVDVDVLLKDAIAKVAASPEILKTFSKVKITGGAIAKVGDFVSSDFKGNPPTASTFHDIQVDGKDTKSVVGNKWGGEDFNPFAGPSK